MSALAQKSMGRRGPRWWLVPSRGGSCSDCGRRLVRGEVVAFRGQGRQVICGECIERQGIVAEPSRALGRQASAEARVLRCLREAAGPLSSHEVRMATHLPLPVLRATLARLELGGAVERAGDGGWSAS